MDNKRRIIRKEKRS